MNSNIPYGQRGPCSTTSETSSAAQLALARILEQALHFFSKGNKELAAGLCTHALEIDPSASEARLLLARMADESGDLSGAEVHLRAALHSEPLNVESLKELTGLLLRDNREQEALNVVLQAAERANGCAGTLVLAAQTAEITGDKRSSIRFRQQLAVIEPENPEHLLIVARCLLELCLPERALAICSSARAKFPTNSDFYVLSSQASHAMGSKEEAEQYSDNALQLDPENPVAWAQSAMIHHHDPDDFFKAEACYRKALELKPNWVNVISNLGSLYLEHHRHHDARRVWSEARSPELFVKNALAITAVPPNIEAIHSDRQRIRDLCLQPPPTGSISNPVNQIGFTNFNTAYHGLPNRDLHVGIADLHRRLCPRLARERSAAGLAHKPRRIGIISRYLKPHTVADYFVEVLHSVQAQGLPLRIFTFERMTNPFLERLSLHSATMQSLPTDLWVAADAIAREKLDLLLYLDIGMDPLTYFLAHIRLTPLQCALYGHPDTTGLPSVDYFISPAIMEPIQGEEHYSENLCALPSLVSGIRRPKVPGKFSRNELGLPANRTLFLCPQSLFKLHPSFDRTLRRLLDEDPEASLLLFHAPKKAWDEHLEQRLNLGPRLTWLPSTSAERFLAICNAVDAVLDTPSFSGGATSYKILGIGVPIVAWPGEFMRSRQTAGLYDHLKIEGPVASNEDEYVNLALRAAHDVTYKAELRQRLLEGASDLFDVQSAAAPLKNFLQNPEEACTMRGKC
ncbi:MAG: hypothetical protein EOL86_11865 [Deltaproteobacteria bacterium]|nr:hypothetical protein [Deltaproteobacteria bacterium]